MQVSNITHKRKKVGGIALYTINSVSPVAAQFQPSGCIITNKNSDG
jgi:hypothetical protein